MKIFRTALKSLAWAILIGVGIAHLWGLPQLIRSSPVHAGNTLENVARIKSQAPEKFRFAVMGDPEDGIQVFGDLVDQAKTHGCDFMIIPGDVIHGERDARFLYFFNKLGQHGFEAPVFAAIGNHDGYESFHKYFGPEDFYFRYSNSLFVMIDSAYQEPDAKQIQWCEAVLKQHRQETKHAFIFLHCPPFPVKKNSPAFTIPKAGSDPFFDMIQKYTVTAVFAAHLHSYRKYMLGPIPYIITGAAGGTLQEDDAFYHYVEVDVDGDAVKDTVVRSNVVPTFMETVERIVVADIFFEMQAHPWLYLVLPGAMVTLWLTRRRTKAAPSVG